MPLARWVIDSRITNARPLEISMSIWFQVLKYGNVCFLRDLKYAFFQLIVEWLVSVFWLYCYVHSLQKWKHNSHLCQTPVSMSHTRSVHVQIQSKWPSWNVAQQVTHTIYCFQGLVNRFLCRVLQWTPLDACVIFLILCSDDIIVVFGFGLKSLRVILKHLNTKEKLLVRVFVLSR